MNDFQISRRECLAALSAMLAPVSYAADELTHALYGFSSKNAPFKAMDKSDYGTWLREHGLNAVFVSANEDESALAALKTSGIAIYQEVGVFVGKSDYQQHPEWRPLTASGEEMKPDGWYYPLSPNHPEVRKQRLERLKKRLENPYLDGVWLDFIRFPLRWENGAPKFQQACFSDESLKAFHTFSGLQTKGGSTKEKAEWILENHLDQWTAFKIESIRSWVAQAAALRDEMRKDVKLAFFGIPWATDDYDNALHRIIGQDYSVLAKHVDIISPMIYHRMIGRPVEWVHDLTLAIKQETHKPVWPILQTMNNPDELTQEEFMRSIELALQASQQGVILFTSNDIEKEGRWAQVKAALSK
ncbi:putative glycoside hydrolase [bacterium]|nr:putative glycoside hydrolase [bacterium]